MSLGDAACGGVSVWGKELEGRADCFLILVPVDSRPGRKGVKRPGAWEKSMVCHGLE